MRFLPRIPTGTQLLQFTGRVTGFTTHTLSLALTIRGLKTSGRGIRRGYQTIRNAHVAKRLALRGHEQPASHYLGDKPEAVKKFDEVREEMKSNA